MKIALDLINANSYHLQMRGTYSAKPMPKDALDSAVGHVIPVHWLTRSQNKVWLEHHGELYQLQITRNGKLILTK